MKKVKQGLLHSALLLSSTLILNGCQHQNPKPDIDTSGIKTAERGLGGSGRQEEERGIGGSGLIAGETGIGGSGRQGEERGIGGSGLIAGETGIGGSGRQEEERGIGGSGLIAGERGLGGSGIRQQSDQTEQWLSQLNSGEKVGVVGTINDFGSVWVNGLHIRFDEETPVLSDGKPISAKDINIGQRAVITATMRGGELWAEKIELIHEVIGPVSNIDTANKQFTVLGQSIQLSAEQLRMPEAGDWVAVSGLRDSEQQIRASYISTQIPDDQVLLRGKLEKQAGRLQISNQPINLSATIKPVSEGSFVVARGHLSNGQLQLNQLQQPVPLNKRADIRLLSIERSADNLTAHGPYSSKPLTVKPGSGGSDQPQVIKAHLQPDHSLRVDHTQEKPPVNWQAPAPHSKQPIAPPPPSSKDVMGPNASAKQLPPLTVKQAPRTPEVRRPPTRPAPPRPDNMMRPPRPDQVARDTRPQRVQVLRPAPPPARPEQRPPTRPTPPPRPESPQPRPPKPQKPPRR